MPKLLWGSKIGIKCNTQNKHSKTTKTETMRKRQTAVGFDIVVISIYQILPCTTGAPRGCERQSCWIRNQTFFGGLSRIDQCQSFISRIVVMDLFESDRLAMCFSLEFTQQVSKNRELPDGSKISYIMRIRLTKVRLRRD